MPPRIHTVETLLRSPYRLLLAALGLACVGLGLVGVVVPGLPTTIFLIAASYLFTRSCPWLERRVFRLRVFRPFVPYVRGNRPMPPQARVAALVMMWSGVSLSLVLLGLGGRLQPWIAVTILGAALVGSICVILVARPGRPTTVAVKANRRDR